MAKEASEEQKISKNFAGFRRLNGWLAVVYTLQGIFLLLLSTTMLLPVEILYTSAHPIATELTGQSTTGSAVRHIGDVNLAYVLSLVFFVAALVHLAAATFYRRGYESGLERRVNGLRWVAYSFSSGVLTVAIALLAGARDLVALGLLFFAAIIAMLALSALEIFKNTSTNSARRFFISLGLLAAAAQWLGLATHLWNTAVYGSSGLPGFVCGLAGSAFVFSVLVGAVAYVSWKKIGRWADYAFVERTYTVLGLVAATVLIWQVFVGALRV